MAAVGRAFGGAVLPLLADTGKSQIVKRPSPVTLFRVPRQSICGRAVSIDARNRTQVRKNRSCSDYALFPAIFPAPNTVLRGNELTRKTPIFIGVTPIRKSQLPRNFPRQWRPQKGLSRGV